MSANYVLHYQHRPTATYSNAQEGIHPITHHECPQREQRYSSTLSLTSGLDGGWVVNATHRPLCTRERASVFIAEEVGWRRSRSGRLQLPPPGLKPPNRPAHNELLYRLRHLYTQPKARSTGNEATIAHAFQRYSPNRTVTWLAGCSRDVTPL